MKHITIPSVLVLATAVAFSAEEAKKTTEASATAPASAADVQAQLAAATVPEIAPEVIRTHTSYGFGFQSGRQFASQVGRYGIGLADIESSEFLKGFLAAMGNKAPEVAEKDIQNAMQALAKNLEAREKTLAAANLEAEKKFLEENGKRKEVVTTKSGLQYEVIAPGGDKKYVAPAPKLDKDGKPEEAQDNKQFMVNYRGTLINGTEFDKSPEGQTVPMTLQVVPGFKEALTTMPIGAKWKLFIPASLAYGEQRRSAELGPNSTLIFDLELVSIEDAPAAPAGGSFPMPQGN